MEAVHRYEGTVNQVMGDGIMALFGAPLAHEDHAVRGLLRRPGMQESVTATRRCPHGTACRSKSASGSTPAMWSCGPSATVCTWTTRRGQTTDLAARKEQMDIPGHQYAATAQETLVLS